MSTVSVSNIKNASSSVNNAVTTSGGDLTNAAGVSFMGGSKNLLYNGAMQVAQRGTSTASITGSGYYTADRWQTLSPTGAGTYTQSIENDAPTGSGFRKSLRMLVTTAQASLGSTAYMTILQQLEGQDVQRIAKGTASAQQLTLSFWVKSNVTGTYTVLLFDADNTRGVTTSYTISASATWEKKTITFPADTTGALDNDNASSLQVYFNLAGGSSYTSGSLQTTWGSFSFGSNWMPGQTNLAASTNNYWQVTGTQLEIGPVATSFEFKSYGQELRECQRYYYRMTASGAYSFMCYAAARTTAVVDGLMPLPVSMRIAPTSVDASNLAFREYTGTVRALSSITVDWPTTNSANISGQVPTTTAGIPGLIIANNNSAAYVAFTAEL